MSKLRARRMACHEQASGASNGDWWMRMGQPTPWNPVKGERMTITHHGLSAIVHSERQRAYTDLGRRRKGRCIPCCSSRGCRRL
jgi:hypothetical protein